MIFKNSKNQERKGKLSVYSFLGNITFFPELSLKDNDIMPQML